MKNEKITYDLPFILLCILFVINNLKPEFLIPGLKSIGLIRQIPNLLTGLLFILWLTQGQKIFHNKQTKLYIAFFSLMVVDTLFARNFGRAIIITKPFLLCVMGYLATIGFVDTFPKLKKLIKIFLFCDIFIAFLGITGGGVVNISTLHDENDFALLMNMLVPFSFFFGMEAEEFRKKVFYFGITGLFVIGAVVSFSRGGFLGLISVLMYCVYNMKKKGLIIVTAIIIAISGYYFAPQGYWDEMATIEEGTQEGTAATRIYLWKNALKVFAYHPILGVGPLNSGVWVTTYDQSDQGARDWGRALHSVYFTLLSELGLVGTFLFIAIIYYGEKDKKYIRDLYHNKSLEEKIDISRPDRKPILRQIRESYFLSHALTGALIGYLTSGIFLSVLYYGWFWAIMTYTVILYNVTRKIAGEIDYT
jgi:O-antigen ligase